MTNYKLWLMALTMLGINGCSEAEIIIDPLPDIILDNDGDKFIASFPGQVGATEYRLYSKRNANDAFRVMVDHSVDVNDSFSLVKLFDPYVYDGVHVYYEVVAVVDGTEKTLYRENGVQPNRVWTDGQLVIDNNSPSKIISGNYRSEDPSKAAIVIKPGTTDVIILNSRIASAANGIEVGNGASVSVTTTRAWGLHPMIGNSHNGKFINGAQPKQVTVEHSYAENWWFHVYIDGQLQKGQDKIAIRYNRLRNVQGRQTNADGSYKPLRYTANGVGHAIQLNGVIACPSVEIAWNEIVQEPTIGFSEDIISLHSSAGLPGHAMLVHDNVVYGAYATEPGKPIPAGGEGGGQYSGCAIISDGGEYKPGPPGQPPMRTADESWNGYFDIYNNIGISTSNAGLCLAGGSNVHMHGNRMIGAGVLEDGTEIYAQNVGAYLYNQYTSVFHNNLIDNNDVGWIQGPHSFQGQQHHPTTFASNNFFFPQNGFNGSKSENNTAVSAPITVATERASYQLFWQRVATEAIHVGLL
jgi:hypothetical protein